jgi:hypothetical protein
MPPDRLPNALAAVCCRGRAAPSMAEAVLAAEVPAEPLPPPGLYAVALVRRPFDPLPTRVLVDVHRLRAAAPRGAG